MPTRAEEQLAAIKRIRAKSLADRDYWMAWVNEDPVARTPAFQEFATEYQKLTARLVEAMPKVQAALSAEKNAREELGTCLDAIQDEVEGKRVSGMESDHEETIDRVLQAIEDVRTAVYGSEMFPRVEQLRAAVKRMAEGLKAYDDLVGMELDTVNRLVSCIEPMAVLLRVEQIPGAGSPLSPWNREVGQIRAGRKGVGIPYGGSQEVADGVRDLAESARSVATETDIGRAARIAVDACGQAILVIASPLCIGRDRLAAATLLKEASDSAKDGVLLFQEKSNLPGGLRKLRRSAELMLRAAERMAKACKVSMPDVSLPPVVEEEPPSRIEVTTKPSAPAAKSASTEPDPAKDEILLRLFRQAIAEVVSGAA